MKCIRMRKEDTFNVMNSGLTYFQNVLHNEIMSAFLQYDQIIFT